MDIISKEIISINGIDKVKIVGIKTGRLAIKESALNSKKPGFISTLLSFKDKEFGQWLPIWVCHTSVGLIANNRLYLFGGDVAYSTNRLVNKVFSATIKSHQENIESCNQILSLAKKMKVVFLPTHDLENAQRLKLV